MLFSLVLAVFLHAKLKSGRKAFSLLLVFSCVAKMEQTGERERAAKHFPPLLIHECASDRASERESVGYTKMQKLQIAHAARRRDEM